MSKTLPIKSNDSHLSGKMFPQERERKLFSYYDSLKRLGGEKVGGNTLESVKLYHKIESGYKDDVSKELNVDAILPKIGM